MAFDPDAYLAKKEGGFDPDAYLASKGIGAPAPVPAAPVNLHPRSESASDAELGIDETHDQAVHKLVADMMPPEPKLNPGALNSLVDRGTFGAFGATLRATGDVGHAASGMDKYRAEHPVLSEITDAPAYLAEGPVQAIAKGVDALLPRVANPIAKIARTGLSTAATTGLQGGTDAASHGAGLGDSLRAGVRAAGSGLVGGTAMGAGTELLARGGTAVMNSRGGRARKFIEDNGGTVGVTSPGKGQPFDEMVTRGTTDADIGRQSVASAEKGLSMLNPKHAARLAPSGELMSRLDRSPAGEEPRIEGIEPLYSTLNEEVNKVGAPPRTESTLGWALDEMDKADAGRFRGQPEIRKPIVTRARSTDDPMAALEAVIGRPLDRASPAEIQQAFKTLRENERLADAAVRAGKPIPERVTQEAIAPDPRSLKESELNRIRRGVSERGNVGTSVSGKDAGPREAAAMLRDLVNQGPYAEANREYAKGSFSNQKERRLLGITERRAGPQETNATVEKVANLIGRRNQRTITAGKGIDRLEQFDRRQPEVGREFAKPAMLRAKGDLSFGMLPVSHGGMIDRLASVGGTGAVLNMAASALGHGAISPLKTMGLLGSALTLRNAPAIQGRLLYGPAKGALEGEGDLLKLIPLLNAARHQETNR